MSHSDDGARCMMYHMTYVMTRKRRQDRLSQKHLSNHYCIEFERESKVVKMCCNLIGSFAQRSVMQRAPTFLDQVLQ